MEMLSEIALNAEKCLKIVENLALAYKEKDAERMEEYTNALIDKNASLLLMSKQLPREFGIERNEDINNAFAIICHEEKNGYRFVLPCLLDKRTGRNYYNVRDNAKQIFSHEFSRLEEKGCFDKVFDCKVDIIYENYYVNQSLMIDNDNIDTKGFTDAISTYLLKDDSPLYCNLIVKGLIGDTNHTEVIVKPSVVD